MLELFTPTNILFLLTIATVLVNVYLSVKKPQVDLEKEDIGVREKTKALVQQVEWEKQATENRFKEIQDSFYKILEVNQNHLHTLETKMDSHIKDNTDFIIRNTETLSRIETLLTSHLVK